MSNNLLVIVMILGWGIGSFLQKVANTHIHPIIVSTIFSLLYLALIPFAWIFVKFDHYVNSTGVVASVFAGLFICISSVACSFALQKGDAGKIGFLSATYPVITLLLSVIFYHEPLTIKKTIGIIFACISFYFLSQGK